MEWSRINCLFIYVIILNLRLNQSITTNEIESTAKYIKAINLSTNKVLISFSDGINTKFIIYNEDKTIDQQINYSSFTYTDRATLSLFGNHINSAKAILVAESNFLIIDITSFPYSISNYSLEKTSSNTLFQTVAFIDDFFIIGLSVSYKAYIYKYSINDNTLISSTSFEMTNNHIACIGMKSNVFVCMFECNNDQNQSRVHYKIIQSNLSYSSSKYIDPEWDKITHGILLSHSDFENNRILYCVFKENSTYASTHYLYCDIGEYSSNALKTVSPNSGNYAVVFPCYSIKYTDIAIFSPNSYAATCRVNGNNNQFLISIISYEINGEMHDVVKNKVYDIGDSVTNVNIVFFEGQDLQLIFNQGDSGQYFTALLKPKCKDIEINDSIQVGVKKTLTFQSDTFIKGADDTSTGSLTIAFTLKDANAVCDIFQGSSSSPIPYDSSITYSTTELKYSTGDHSSESKFYFEAVNPKGIVSTQCLLTLKITGCVFGCLTCSEVGIASNMKCLSCDNDSLYYKKSDESGYHFNCYSGDVDYYYLDTSNKVYKPCFDSCKSCNSEGTAQSNNCITCKANYYHSFYDNTQCWNMTTKPDNFYLDVNDNVFKKCPDECASCIMSESVIKCSTCNNIDEYYSIQGDSSQCVQPPQQGYYLDLISSSFQRCYHLCEECKGGYSSIEHNCTSCKTGYRVQPLTEFNCIKECDYTVSYWYLDDNNIYKCTSGLHCPESRPILEWHNKQCIENCKPSGTCEYCKDENHILYLYNNECLENCPSKTKASRADRMCVDDDICKYEEYTSNIKLDELSNNMNSIGQNYSIQYAHTEKQVVVINSPDGDYKTIIFELEECTYSIANELTQLNLANCPQTLRDKYLIPYSEALIILKTDIIREGQNTNQIAYAFFNKKGTPLNLQYCSNEKFEVKYPITNPDAVDFELALNMSEIGVDIYNASDPFFTDICFPFTSEEGEDVSLEDRRERYYKNVSFCEVDCEYNGIDYLTQEVICECNVKTNFITEALNNSFTSEFLEIIESARVEIFKCYKNVFNIKGFLTNLGGWIMIGFITIESILLTVYLFKELKDIKIYLLQYVKEEPSNPPKSNNEINTGLYYQPPKKFVIDDIEKEEKQLVKEYELNSPSLLINKSDKTNEVAKKNPIVTINLNTNNHIKEIKEKPIINLVKLPENIPQKRNTLTKIKDFFLPSTKNIEKTKNPVIPKLNMIKAEEKNTTINNIGSLIDDNSEKAKSDLNSILQRRTTNTFSTNATHVGFDEKKINEKTKIVIVFNKDNLPQHKSTKLKVKNRIKYNNNYSERDSSNSFKTEKARMYIKKDTEDNMEEDEDLTEEELNELCVEDARKYDNRHFCLFFWQLLKSRQDIINTFCNSDPLDCFPIRCICFFYGISFYFFVNALFFIPSYISDTFHGKNSYSFFTILQNEISRFIYSAIVSMVVDLIENFLSNSKKRLEILIRKSKFSDKFQEEAYQICKSLKIRHIIFLVFAFLFMGVFWYYISAFCNVYYNSRINWLEGSIITYTLTNVSPFISSFLISSFRFIGMKVHFLSFFYKLSQIISAI